MSALKYLYFLVNRIKQIEENTFDMNMIEEYQYQRQILYKVISELTK